MKLTYFLSVITVSMVLLYFSGCSNTCTNSQNEIDSTTLAMKQKVDEYALITLTTDISFLSEKEKQMLPLLFKAADIMDELYWLQAFGDKNLLYEKIKDDYTRQFVDIHYGPWDRLRNDTSFIPGYGEKPKGATFYPEDMTKEEFDKLEAADKTSLYTIIRRKPDGTLYTIPYSEAYKDGLEKAANYLKQAAELAEDEGLKKYLTLRAKAFLTNEYFESDMAWMDMKSNNIDIVIGPIENYEDRLFGYKTAFESFILIKDIEWSKKLERFTSLLPELQKRLPVEPKYKSKIPGNSSDLYVYDAVYYTGDCSSGTKSIAINLPNDEKVQELKGSRRLQLKNTMRAKFENILVPISNLVIAQDQRKHIKFNAFFENVMFHEVGHGLGLDYTIDNKNTIRKALQDYATSIEEGKADILSLYSITQLYEMGVLNSGELMDNYVTFVASIFRSVRFGASSAHGKANMTAFNFFLDSGAFSRDQQTQTYRIDFEKMKQAIKNLSALILTIQGNGDYEAAKKLIDEKGVINPELQNDLNRIASANIPRDLRLKQGPDVLGLK